MVHCCFGHVKYIFTGFKPIPWAILKGKANDRHTPDFDNVKQYFPNNVTQWTIHERFIICDVSHFVVIHQRITEIIHSMLTGGSRALLYAVDMPQFFGILLLVLGIV